MLQKMKNNSGSVSVILYVRFIRQVLIVLPVMLACLIPSAHAKDITLQWDPVANADYYTVYWGEKPGTYTSNSGKISSPTTTYAVTGLENKIYYFSVKAFNACNDASPSSLELTYDGTAGAGPPVASAGPDQTVQPGATVTLNGTGSTDPDNDIAAYLWTQTAGTAVTLSSTTIASPTFAAPSTSDTALTFQLTVTDTGGLTSTDTATVNVTAPEPGIRTVTLAWDPNPDAAYYTVYWGETPGNYTSDSGRIDSPTTTYTVTGIQDRAYYFSIKAFNACGDASPFSVELAYGGATANDPPVASAGADQSIPEGLSVTLDGSGSTDPDDGIASYLWTQTAGPTVTLSDSTTVNPTFVAPDVMAEGTTLTFQLTVTDQGGLQSTDNCIVSVAFQNQAPVAGAGPDQSVNAGTTVTLNGAGSTDPDDGIASYLWTQTGGPSVALSSASAASPTFTAPVVDTAGATLSFQLTVTDNGGLTATDSSLVTVTFLNQSPIANAGPSRTIAGAGTVTLDGTASSDPDDGIASYLWSQTGGPSVSLTNTASPNPSFTAPAVTTGEISLSFQLTVTDKGGLTSTDSTSITISAPELVPGQITLAWDKNPDAAYYKVYWGDAPGSYTSESEPIVSPTTTYTVTGLGEMLYFFAVKAFNVCDMGGEFSPEIAADRRAVNELPIASAGEAQTVQGLSTVSLDGSGSTDPDDGIATYLWLQTGGTPVNLSDPTAVAPTFIAPDVGTGEVSLTFTLTVTDNGGLQSSDTCVVNVTAENLTPLADAGPDQTILEGTLVSLNGAGSTDPDGTIVSFIWTQVGGPTASLTDPQTATPSFTAPDVSIAGGQILLQLTVTDNMGGRATDTCVVDIKTSTDYYGDESFKPLSPNSLISTINDFPSIEVFDKNFKHLEWLKIGWAEYNDANGEARIATGDIDGDGEDEVIIGMAQVPKNPSLPAGFFQVLDHDFSHLAWGRVNWPEYNDINGETWPACGDMDGDGDDEIIIGLGLSGEGGMEVFDFNAGKLTHLEWVIVNWPDYNTSVGQTRPACGDIDDDGIDEIVVGLGPLDESPAIPNGMFEVIDDDFNHLAWGKLDWLEYNELSGETWPACGDITGNGYDEIIIGLGVGGDGRAALFEFINEEPTHAAWMKVDWIEYNEISGETRPASADVDDDGKEEIILGLGPVPFDPSIPDGLFQIIDDDYTILEWAQINWTTMNAMNGETRPAYGFVNGADNIFIGLGSQQIDSTVYEQLPRSLKEMQEAAAAAAEAGCFIRASAVKGKRE